MVDEWGGVFGGLSSELRDARLCCWVSGGEDGGGGMQGLRRREGVREGSVMGLIEKPLLRKKQIMRGGFFSFRIDYRWRVGGEAIGGEQYGYEGLVGSRRGVRF